MTKSYFIPKTHSTNALFREMLRKENLIEGFLIHTDFQGAGKGQGGNSWESAEGENLLFSMVLYPEQIAIDEQFILSQLVSIAIKKVLDQYVEDVTIKWPNDIYWKDKKMAGILIESSLQGSKIKSTVIGVGLNVNQTEFFSDAPNPISLSQIIGQEQDRTILLESIAKNIMLMYSAMNTKSIQSEYAEMLYRKEGFHLYQSGDDLFKASIHAVRPDGQLVLLTEKGSLRNFYFKEVAFVY
jgi:BirA family biotin operon repressor/biotin-[acetyl-CoA-carboxylase] ligase